MTMGPKKLKRMMSIELKREIIEKYEQGVRVADLARHYGRSTSTICAVLKQKEFIKGITLAKGVTILSKLRSSVHEKMENLLAVWVTEKQLQGDTLTQGIICEKARAIYGDLLEQTPRTSADDASKDSFKASRGWFDNFRKRSGIHSIVRHGEAASSEVRAAERTFGGFEPEVSVKEEEVSPGNSVDLGVDERDVKELVQEHPRELTTKDLQELQTQQHSEVLQEIGLEEVLQEIAFKEEPEVEEISTSEIKEILGMWERVSHFVEKKHPEKVATGRALELFNETCLTHFRNILKGRKRQTSVDTLFSKSAKNAKTSSN